MVGNNSNTLCPNEPQGKEIEKIPFIDRVCYHFQLKADTENGLPPLQQPPKWNFLE
jgi:hypothetical protein